MPCPPSPLSSFSPLSSSPSSHPYLISHSFSGIRGLMWGMKNNEVRKGWAKYNLFRWQPICMGSRSMSSKEDQAQCLHSLYSLGLVAVERPQYPKIMWLIYFESFQPKPRVMETPCRSHRNPLSQPPYVTAQETQAPEKLSDLSRSHSKSWLSQAQNPGLLTTSPAFFPL